MFDNFSKKYLALGWERKTKQKLDGGCNCAGALSSHIEPLSSGSVNDTTKMFWEAISFFDITLFEKKINK